jgi:hypothetical protein
VTVAIAFCRAVPATVAKPAEKAGQFLFENGLDGRAHVGPQPLLDRVEPGLFGQWHKARGVGNLVHGVISLAVAAAGWVGVSSPGDYAAFKFPPTSRHDRM